jgi:hypothetical protein
MSRRLRNVEMQIEEGIDGTLLGSRVVFHGNSDAGNFVAKTNAIVQSLQRVTILEMCSAS